MDRAKVRSEIDGAFAAAALAAQPPNRDTWGLEPDHIEGDARATALLDYDE